MTKGYFSKQFAKQMLPSKQKSGTFYLLPKVHNKYEKIPKGRPIISSCGSNTEMISWFCDQVLKEKVKEQDSFIEDTPHILRFYESLNANGEVPPDSSHPGHITKNIVYSMGFRLLRICSSGEKFEYRLTLFMSGSEY